MTVQAHDLLETVDLAIHVPVEDASLEGLLALPVGARGLVIFAHGSGSSRLSPRNRRVAGRLLQEGLGTLLFDLLTPGEERADADTGRYRFDLPLLAGRLGDASRWVARQPWSRGLKLGFFGASTGAGAALMAAAENPDIAAVVSRGGRPDLAGEALAEVKAPTLLLVGGLDGEVLAFNRWALAQLAGPKELKVVPGAGHLFEEPGTLDEVAELAAAWFDRHLAGS